MADDRDRIIAPQNAKRLFAGFGRASELLFGSTGDAIFRSAQAACGRLGLRLADPDEVAHGFFRHHIKAAVPPADVSIEGDLRILRAAAIAGSHHAEPEHSRGVDEIVGEPDSYRYSAIAALLATQAAAPRRR